MRYGYPVTAIPANPNCARYIRSTTTMGPTISPRPRSLLLALLGIASVLLPSLSQAQDAWLPINRQAAILIREGKYAQSLVIAQKGLAVCDTAGATAVFCRSIFWQNMADDFAGLHLYAKAEAAYRRSLAVRQAGLPPTHPLIGDALERLGVFYVRRARWADAEPMLAKAAAVFRASPEASRMLITTLTWLTQTDVKLNKAPEAIAAAKEAVAVADTTHSPEALLMRSNLATALQDAERNDEALAVVSATRATAAFRHASPSLQLQIIATGINAAVQVGQRNTALSLVGRGQKILDAGGPIAESDKVRFLLNTAKAFESSGRLDEAAARLTQLRQVANAPNTLLSPDLQGDIAQQSGRLARDLGHNAESRADFHRVAELYTRAYGADSSMVADALQWEAAAAAAQGDVPAANQLIRSALDILRRAAASPVWWVPADRLASDLAYSAGDFAAAKKYIADAAHRLPLIPAAYAGDRLGIFAQQAQLASTRQEALGEAAQAIGFVDQAAALDPYATQLALVKLAQVYNGWDEPEAALRLLDRARTLPGAPAPTGVVSASILAVQGQTLSTLGKYQQADAACTRAQSLVTQATDKILWSLATECLGDAQLRESRADKAAVTYRSVLSALGPTDTSPLDRIYALEGLGSAEDGLGDYAAALTLLDSAVALAAANKEPTFLGPLGEGLIERGSVLRRLGRYADAEDDLRRALAIMEQLGADDLSKARILNNLGLTLLDRGTPRSAEPLLREALRFRLRAGRADLILESRANLAVLDRALGKLRTAAAELASIAADQQKLGESEKAAYAITLARQSAVAAQLGDTAEAERLGRAAIDIDARRLGPDNPVIANRMLALATLIAQRGDRREAEELRRSALAIIAKAFGKASPVTAKARLALIPDLARRGDGKAIRKILDRCITATEAAYGKNSPMLLGCLTASANEELTTLALTDAARDTDQAIAIESKSVGAANPLVADLLLIRARIDTAENRTDAAFVRIDAADKALGGDVSAIDHIPIALERAALQAGRGEFPAAAATARAALASLPPGSDAAVVNFRIALTDQLTALDIRQGQPDHAVALWRDLIPTVPAWAVPDAMNGLAASLLATGHPDEAAATLAQVLTADQSLHGPQSPEVQAAHAERAIALADAGHLDQGDKEASLIGAGNDWRTELLRITTRYQLSLRHGDMVEAAVYQTRIVALMTARFGTQSPALLTEIVNLARLDLLIGRDKAARALLGQAEPMAAIVPNRAAIALAELRAEIAQAAGDKAGTELQLRRAAKLAAGPFGSMSSEGGALAELGQFYLNTGRLSDASRELEAARSLCARSTGPRAAITGRIVFLLAVIAEKQGHAYAAAALRAEAQSILGTAHPVVQSPWL